MPKKLIKNPTPDDKYIYRLIKERNHSRDSGDALAKEIINYLESDSDSPKKLMKALEKYSKSEGWNPGLIWVEKNS